MGAASRSFDPAAAARMTLLRKKKELNVGKLFQSRRPYIIICKEETIHAFLKQYLCTSAIELSF